MVPVTRYLKWGIGGSDWRDSCAAYSAKGVPSSQDAPLIVFSLCDKTWTASFCGYLRLQHPMHEVSSSLETLLYLTVANGEGLAIDF